MTAPTYGVHAEAVAVALRGLVVDGDVPAGQSDVTDLLACREAVIDALQERLHAFGLTPSQRPARYARSEALSVLTHVDHQLGSLLDRVVYEMPRLIPGSRDQRPSDLLGPRKSHPTVERWRTTAVELMAGTHALCTTEERTWATDPGAGWYVMRDLATAIESAVVLDLRLKQLGLLNEHDRCSETGTVDEHRLIASHVARVATWYATSSSPDEATVAISGGERVTSGPVQIVSTPRDLIGAQRRLATYLRPLTNHGSAYNAEPQIAAATAQQVVASQLFLAGHFMRLAEIHPRANALASDFSAREDVLTSLLPQLRYLVDVRRYEEDRHRRAQQGEITAAVTSWVRNKKPVQLTSAQLLDLANATHEVTHNLAVSLRRELLRKESNLGLAHPIHHDRVLPARRRSRLDAVLTDLKHLAAPTTPVTECGAPLQRAALRGLLDLTPTESRAPYPHPVALRPERGQERPGLPRR